jgi:hypothetical protein
MMTRIQYFLKKVEEEGGEVGHQSSKAMCFGVDAGGQVQ